MNLAGLLAEFVPPFTQGVLWYFTLLNAATLLHLGVSLARILRFRRRSFPSDYEQMRRSEMTWPVTILVPSHDVAETIVATVRSLLALDYGEFEIVVINDGSQDDTLRRLVDTFHLRRTDRVYHRVLDTATVRGIYAALETPNLVVVDKVRGGRADALNTGLNVARYPLVCPVDAGAIVEDDALLRLAKPFMDRPREVVAAGGIGRMVNGCEVRDGRVARPALPPRALPVLQVIEALRSLLGGAGAWNGLRAALAAPRGLTLLLKSAVLEAGGYDRGTAGGRGEGAAVGDFDLLLRLHARARGARRRCGTVFLPAVVSWSRAPETAGELGRDRARRHRDIVRTLWRRRGMIGNPGHGVLGLWILPCMVLFDVLGPSIETLAFIVLPLAWWLGALGTDFFLLFLVLAVFFGIFLSVTALLIEEVAFRWYRGWEPAATLLVACVVENVWYRPVLAFLGIPAFPGLVLHRDDVRYRGSG